jgi:hypothetical protein
MGDEIPILPSTGAIRPTDHEMPRREQQAQSRRRQPSPKRPRPEEPAAQDDEPRQVGSKLDVRG